jgi:hypothetical protein
MRSQADRPQFLDPIMLVAEIGEMSHRCRDGRHATAMPHADDGRARKRHGGWHR